jgi:ATP-dependent DNA helicase PIF1
VAWLMSKQRLDFNPEFQRAMELLNAGQNVFITGKAGTGKSTLLQYFLRQSNRSAVVVAPTGVAAINVGGSTIHRLFSFRPSITSEEVFGKEYFPGKNRKLISELEVLVVDEVSMVRADLMDSMEAALRRFGPHRGRPFGGVQMVFVGDPYQLPPVVIDSEDAYFHSRYATPFFFSADAFRTLEYEIVQLEKIYRQSDSEFIDILNAIRTGDASQDVFDRLNERYIPEFDPPNEEFWITLTTTNKMAEGVNRKRLENIDAPLVTQDAVVWGEIAPADFPTDENLKFKDGAQIMLLNNDPKDRWANGSLGVIRSHQQKGKDSLVRIEMVDSGEVVEVEPFVWEVTRPVIQRGRLKHEIIGSFRQLPFKLAWAVTIHKSQGKTLERVVVSLGRGTFADGQLYVALSRCTSLEGMVLKSLVKKHHVKVEREVTRFLKRQAFSSEYEVESGIAFVGVLSTGTSRFDKIFEIGVVIHRPDGSIETHSSLLNPMRDIGSTSHHGIAASDVSLAPSFGEAWPFFARRMNGCVVVAHGLPLIQTMIERQADAELNKVDLGLGIDTQSFTKLSLDGIAESVGSGMPEQPTALELANMTASIFATLDISNAVTTPYIVQKELLAPGRIQSRDHGGINWQTSVEQDPQIEYSDIAAAVINSDFDARLSRETLAQSASTLGLGSETVADINMRLLESLKGAARRDGSTSPNERIQITHAAEILGLRAELVNEEKNEVTLAHLLREGAQLCFTGTPTDLFGNLIEKTDLERLARERGLIPVKSVTKKCVVVIAEDSASMSNKAKEARALGRSIRSVHEFLEWASPRG